MKSGSFEGIKIVNIYNCRKREQMDFYKQQKKDDSDFRYQRNLRKKNTPCA